jgi:predicted DNA-binding mobile mystery protein A
MDLFTKLQLRQLDTALEVWRTAALAPRPRQGWIRALRMALGMSARALGARIGVTEAAIRSFEAAEASDAITLGSLRKLAEALDCELQYALVPRTSLAGNLQARAVFRASELLAPVSHSMALEAQKVDSREHAAQVETLAEELLNGDRRKLW